MIEKKALCKTRSDHSKLQLRFQHSTRFPNLGVYKNRPPQTMRRKNEDTNQCPPTKERSHRVSRSGKVTSNTKESSLTQQQVNLGTFCYRIRIHKENG